MISKELKKQMHNENFENFLEYLNKMHKIETFNFKNLRRNLRPFFKTRSLNDRVYFLTLKHSKQSIAFEVQKLNEKDSSILIHHSTGHRFIDNAHFIVDSNKEFLEKLLNQKFFTYAK